MLKVCMAPTTPKKTWGATNLQPTYHDRLPRWRDGDDEPSRLWAVELAEVDGLPGAQEHLARGRPDNPQTTQSQTAEMRIEPCSDDGVTLRDFFLFLFLNVRITLRGVISPSG